MSSATIRRRKLKIENPEKYAEFLAKHRETVKKYREKKMRKWEEGTHTQAEIDEYNAQKEQIKHYKREYYLKKKAQRSRQTRNSAGANPNTPISEDQKKRPKDMSPNELREYNTSKRREQRAALSYQKKTAIRLKDRERMRKKREAAKLDRINNSPAGQSDTFGRLKQSAYNLNHEFRSKSKKLAMSPMEYAQTALNLLNPRTPEKKQAIRELQKKHPCRSLFNTQEPDYLNLEEELGIELQDTILEEPEPEEEISKPLHNIVQLFYVRDDISRMLPHARYSTKHGAARVMMQTIKAAHQLFKQEHPSLPMSLTLFQTLRPKNVRLLGSVPIDSCLCVYCTNVRLMINALNRHLGSSGQLPKETEMLRFLTCPTEKDWPDMKCVDGACVVCADRMRPFKIFCRDIYSTQGVRWRRWAKSEAGKLEPMEKEGSIRDLLTDLQKALEEPTKGTSFLQHLFTAFWQYRQFKICRNNPEENEIVMVQDFGENRKAAYASEIKSAHFGKNQISVHPVVCFYRCGDQVVRHSIIFLTDDICHDHHAVKTFTTKALELLNERTSFSKVTIWSDGAASQYKGKGTFCDLSNMLGLDVQRCYYGSEHGKGESDGETGLLSQALKRAVHEGISFRDAKDMVDHLSKLNKNSNREYVLVSSIERDSTDDDSLAIPGSRKLHQYQRLAAYVLRARRLCCFCCACRQNKFNMCVNADIVGEYEVHKLKPNVNVILNNGFLEDPDVQRKSSAPETESSEHRLKVGDYVKLQCSVNKVKKVFYAVVIVAPTEQSADFSVRYLQKSGTSYVFGNQIDEGLIAPGPPDYYTWEFIQPDKYRLDNRGHHFFGI